MGRKKLGPNIMVIFDFDMNPVKFKVDPTRKFEPIWTNQKVIIKIFPEHRMVQVAILTRASEKKFIVITKDIIQAGEWLNLLKFRYLSRDDI